MSATLEPTNPGPDTHPAEPCDDADAPPWRAWTAPAALALALVAANLLGTVVYVVALTGQGSGTHSAIADLVATLVQDLCFVGVALFFAQLVARPTGAQFGLRRTHVWRGAWLVVAGYVAFLLVTKAWLSALNLHETEDLPNQLGANDGTGALAAVTVLVCVVAPICEELLFRGYMFTALRRRAGTWGAAIIVGLLFGGVHAISSPAGFLLPLALFGLALCLLYAWTRSLYPCIALHALNNSIAFGSSEHWRWWAVALLVAGAYALIVALIATVRWALGAVSPPPAPA